MGLGVVGLEADRLAEGSAMASSSLPWSLRAVPRLKWASASSGLSRIASRRG